MKDSNKKNMEELIDLHTHTNASDADIHLSPEKLVKLAYENNIKAIAVTDHDSVASVEKAIKAGEKIGVEIVPGSLELSTFEGELEPHILGYYLDYKNSGLVDSLKNQIKGRDKRSRLIVEKFNAAGANLNFDELRKKTKSAYVAKYHIALELVKQGFIDNIFEVFKETDKGGFAYVPYSATKEYLFGVESGIKLLRKYDAVTVWAHPGNLKLDKKEERKFLEDMIKWGLQGIEAYSRRHTAEQMKHYESLANEYDLLMTGGTDFHGLIKGKLVGTWDGSFKVPYNILEELKGFKGL